MAGEIKIIDIAEQRKAKAWELHRNAINGLLEHVCNLVIIYKNKFFVELGFNTMQDYCREMWGYARSTMYRKLNVGEKLINALNIDNTNENKIKDTDVRVLYTRQIENFDEENIIDIDVRVLYTRQTELVHLNEFMKLQEDKQYLLSRLEYSKFNNLLSNGTVKLGSKTFTLKDIKETDRDTLRNLINGNKYIVRKGSNEFERIYKRAERLLNNLVYDYEHCAIFTDYDIQRLNYHVKEISKIYDQYIPQISDRNENKIS